MTKPKGSFLEGTNETSATEYSSNKMHGSHLGETAIAILTIENKHYAKIDLVSINLKKEAKT